MEIVEAEGSTIDEAIDRALQRLGVTRDAAEVEILHNATKGLLGLGGTPAKVRASVRRGLEVDFPPPSPPTPSEMGDAKRSERDVSRLEKGGPGGISDEDAGGPDIETVERARPILGQMIELMGVAAEARVAMNEEGPHLTLVGDSSGILIGRQGQTLDALEYLVNRIVARDDESRRRITVDTEGYRARRRATLEQLAKRTAAKVHSAGKPVMLDPMSPRDRRIIHLTLRGDSSLATRSSGEGYYKQVVIAPQRGRGGGRRGNSV